MYIETRVDVYQFNPNILADIKSFNDMFTNCWIKVQANEFPEWLAKLDPKIYITTSGVWDVIEDSRPYQIHFGIGNKHDFIIKPCDYIIRCKNNDIIMMKQKDFESLIGKFD